MVVTHHQSRHEALEEEIEIVQKGPQAEDGSPECGSDMKMKIKLNEDGMADMSRI